MFVQLYNYLQYMVWYIETFPNIYAIFLKNTCYSKKAFVGALLWYKSVFLLF